MVRTCAVDGCKSTTGLHSFPSDRHMARRWLQMAGRSLDSKTAAMYICNLHFSRECYSNYMEVELGFVSTCHLRLTPSAVPNPANFLPFPTPSRVFSEVACQTESDPAVKETACQTCPVGVPPDTVQTNMKPSRRSQADDYNRDMQSEMIRGAIKKLLKTSAMPALFGSDIGHGEGDPREKRRRIEMNTPSTAAKTSTSVVSGSSVDTVLKRTSVLTSIASGAPSTSSHSPPPPELRESLSSAVSSKNRLNESSPQETETTTSKSDENTEKDLSGSRTIVNNSCLMELFKKCQTCGKPITKKNMSHCGAQTKVAWSCLGGHRGTWMSSPLLWDAFPEIHLLTALSILFSGGSFTQFKTWAKHLHLNFMGQKTFFEIQKAYLNPETNRTERDKILEVSQQLEGTLPHQISDQVRKIKAKSRRRRSGALSSLSSNENRPLVSTTSSGKCTQESTPLLSLEHVSASERDKRCQQDDDDEHQCDSTDAASEVDCLQETFDEMEVTLDNDECNGLKNRESDLHSDVDNDPGTAELSAPGEDDSCDEDVYVPVIPQRSKMSELLLECEEEELEPWQKQTLQVHLKVEDDVGELSIDQIDCKPDPESLQTNATPPELKEESPQPVVFNSQGFTVASPQLTSNTKFIGSPGNSLPIVTAGQQQLFQKVFPATVTPEAYGVIHTSEMQQISNNPLSLSSVQSLTECATPSDQTTSQTLSEPFPLSCFTILKLKSAQQTHNKL